ncbi:MAG: phage tail protein [Bacillota bacterium]|nr:phage tail protein [Bacillota bacterium]
MSTSTLSKYTQYLPAIFQKSYNEADDEYFLGRFLLAFERQLTGRNGTVSVETGIEDLLDRIDKYFDPANTPVQFLPWLAGWVGLELEENLEFTGYEDDSEKDLKPLQLLPLAEKRASTNRTMIESMLQLYKKRGTWDGLTEYLQFYSGNGTTITVDECESPTRLGIGNRVGYNSVVGRAGPCFFSVYALIPAHSSSILKEKVRMLKEVIEREKPFYTNYILNVEVPAMRVGAQAKVGSETLLGGMVE